MAVLMKEMFGDVRPNTTMCECDFLVISQRGRWLHGYIVSFPTISPFALNEDKKTKL